MTTPNNPYDVLALRYASRESNKASEYFRYDVYRQPDAVQETDYFFWLVRNGDRTVLVDCGFNRERGLSKNRVQETDPLELLARVDVAAEDVDHVVISHMHYDHVGNVDLFPNATFSIAREEYDFWTGTYGTRELMRAFVIPEELAMVQSLHEQERLHFIDKSEELFPGVVATILGGHTAGQLMVQVETASDHLVLAADAVHYFEELELDRPFKLFHDIGDMYRAFDVLRDVGSRPDHTVIAGHDPRVRAMFDSVVTDCIDLTSPRQGH